MGLRKPRSDSKLLNLPTEQAEQLCDWLLGGMSYNKAVLLLEKSPFYIETSTRALGEFYQSYCSLRLVQRREQAAGVAEAVAKSAAKNPGQFHPATIATLERLAFELANSPRSKPGEVKQLFMLLLKSRDQDLKNKQVEISMRKLERLEKQDLQARETLGDSKLTPAQRQSRLKEIFGL